MRTFFLTVAGTSLLVALLATTARAEAGRSAPATATPAAGPDSAPVAVVRAPARPPSPMMLEIRAALDREREQIEGLRLRLRGASNAREALALERQVERVKLDTEIAILRIQADAARRAGRTALAARIDAAIGGLLAPPAPATPVARPAPHGSSR